MVVAGNQELDHISLVKASKSTSNLIPSIPTVDLSDPSGALDGVMIRACEELGFFKVTNHGVDMESTRRLQKEAEKFFSRPHQEKETLSDKSFHYGSRTIGNNGDVGWVEFILMWLVNSNTLRNSVENDHRHFLGCLREYIREVKKLACEVLERMATGMGSEERDVLSRKVMKEESDSCFRINHYPSCSLAQGMVDCSLTGFGEHTDPQIISVLLSNDSSGLQISLKDGRWVSIPPDQSSFFIFVGDSLQVLTNGRFRSVRHRVLANSRTPRLSMIYFGGPPCEETIAPLRQLMEEGEESKYKEFTWEEYKTSAYKTRLAEDRLLQFQKTAL